MNLAAADPPVETQAGSLAGWFAQQKDEELIIVKDGHLPQAQSRSVKPCRSESARSADRGGQHRLKQRQTTNSRSLCRVVILCAVALLLAACSGGTHLSFLDAQGPIADAQRWHFYWVLAIMTVLVAGPIFLLLPFWAWRYRYGRSTAKYSPNWQFSRFLEIMAWTGPIIIVIILAIFVWRDTHKLDPYKPIASDQAPLRVQVIGYDWKWLFIYPDQGIASIGTLALPTGRPVSLHLTSATVMQAFFIPSLGSQIYAMGGMVSQLNLEASKPGKSLGENTMYNGDGFHQQKFAAVAMTPAQFQAWVTKVHTTGVPLDAQTLKAIARQTTRAQLIAALPKASTVDGNLYFSGVNKSLFPAVVKAVMEGKSEPPQTAFAQAGARLPAADNTAPTKEQKP